jgi:hypothetical protein
MIQSGLEKFGAHQKAQQLFNLVVADVEQRERLLFSFPRHPTLDPQSPTRLRD